MKVTAIVYTSNTGYTEQYARMLGEQTGLPVYALPEAPRGESVLYLGWMMAGSVVGLGKAKRRCKVRACCAVGMGGAEQTPALQKKHPGFPVFCLRGGYDHQRLTGIYKKMMETLAKAMKKRPAGDLMASTIVEAVSSPTGMSWVTAEQLEPVLAWLEG